jgi:hypothetical protein
MLLTVEAYRGIGKRIAIGTDRPVEPAHALRPLASFLGGDGEVAHRAGCSLLNSHASLHPAAGNIDPSLASPGIQKRLA